MFLFFEVVKLINSVTGTLKISLNFESCFNAGLDSPVSHFETALFVTPKRLPSSFCEKPFSFLKL